MGRGPSSPPSTRCKQNREGERGRRRKVLNKARVRGRPRRRRLTPRKEAGPKGRKEERKARTTLQYYSGYRERERAEKRDQLVPYYFFFGCSRVLCSSTVGGGGRGLPSLLISLAPSSAHCCLHHALLFGGSLAVSFPNLLHELSRSLPLLEPFHIAMH